MLCPEDNDELEMNHTWDEREGRGCKETASLESWSESSKTNLS